MKEWSDIAIDYPLLNVLSVVMKKTKGKKLFQFLELSSKNTGRNRFLTRSRKEGTRCHFKKKAKKDTKLPPNPLLFTLSEVIVTRRHTLDTEDSSLELITLVLVGSKRDQTPEKRRSKDGEGKINARRERAKKHPRLSLYCPQT